jgi:hypothetical protein
MCKSGQIHTPAALSLEKASIFFVVINEEYMIMNNEELIGTIEYLTL